MPNWCDSYIQILAKEDIIQWICENLNENAGRRWDDPITRKGFEFIMGDEVWFSLKIWSRTTGGGLSDFLNLILDKFKNIHIKGHYYVELIGGGDFEEGTDEQGNRYYFHTELPSGYPDEDDDVYLYEFPTEEELNHNVYNILEKEDQEEIDQLLPYELYGWDEPCMLSAYHGMLDDHDWVTYGVWLQGIKDLEAWGDDDDEYEIPTEEMINHDVWKDLEKEYQEELTTYEEAMFDDMRIQYPQYYNASVILGHRIPNYSDWDYYEEDIYYELKSRGWSYTQYDKERGILYYNKNNEEIDLNQDLNDIPTEDELEWDQERVNDLDMWYYITGSTSPKERDRIECDLWDMYHWWKIYWSETNDGNGIPAPSGMGYIYMIDFLGKFIQAMNEDIPSFYEIDYNVYELLEKEDEENIPRQDELDADQINIDEDAHWESWWWREKSDDLLEDIRYTYRCYNIFHTYKEPTDIFHIPSPVGGFFYLTHQNGDVFHSEDEGIIKYLKLLSEHDVYEEIEKQEKEDLLAFADLVRHEWFVLNQDSNLLFWSKESEDYIYWTDREFEYVSLEVEQHDVWKDVEQEEKEDYEDCCIYLN